MRFFRKVTCALLLMALIAVPVMAQGSQESGGASTGPVEIKIATWTSNPDQIALLNSFVDEFAAKEGIEINAEFESIEFGEYNTKLSLELQGSEAPDVFWVLETSAPAFIQSGLLAPLDAELAEYNPEDFSAKAMELWQSNGVTYASFSITLISLPQQEFLLQRSLLLKVTGTGIHSASLARLSRMRQVYGVIRQLMVVDMM